MPQVGFEPTIPVFERAKTDRAVTVIGAEYNNIVILAITLTRTDIEIAVTIFILNFQEIKYRQILFVSRI
jgi:hypothetical protein